MKPDMPTQSPPIARGERNIEWVAERAAHREREEQRQYTREIIGEILREGFADVLATNPAIVIHIWHGLERRGLLLKPPK